MIQVLSKLKAHPAKEDAVRRALEEMVTTARASTQRFGYGLLVSTDDPSEFLVVERHTSAEEHAPEGQNESMLLLGVALRESLREPIEVVGRYSVLAEV